MSIKRDLLIKEALCILLAGLAQEQLDLESGFFCDDLVISEYERHVQHLVDEHLPGEYGERFTKVAQELEGNKAAVGNNGSLVHALAVELAAKALPIIEKSINDA